MPTRISEATRTKIASAWPTILARIAAGDLIRDALAEFKISRAELDAFKLGDAGMAAEWRTAREASADAFMEEAMENARAKVPNIEAQHVRTRIDTLKWAARTRNPQSYGEKAQLDVNVKTMDLTRIIEAANARVLEAQRGRVIEHNTGESRADLALAHVQQTALLELLPTAKSIADLL